MSIRNRALIICTCLWMVPPTLWASETIANGSTASGPLTSLNPQRVYGLAVGCCVPWLEARFCRDTTQDFVDVLLSRTGIPKVNVRTLFDKEATYRGMEDGLKWLEAKTGKQDTAMIFYLGHGRQLPDQNGDEADGQDEILWLWSEKMPRTQWYAVNTKIWMKDDQFSRLIRSIGAGRIIVIMDTCRAHTVVEPMPRLDDTTQIAVITSVSEGEDSWMILDWKDLVFTRALIQSMKNRASDLFQAYEIAKKQTVWETKAIAENTRLRFPGKKHKPQTPQIIDPHGIVRLLKFTY